MPQCLGLIEVLPLNFKCLSSSNGTSVDKSSLKHDKSLYVLPEYFSLFGHASSNDNNNKAKEAEEEVEEEKPKQNIDTSIFNSIFNFNPLQFLVIERMEPISRHFVVLDFGFPVALTDVMIPSCSELSSISIDLWTQKEQKDSKRLCVSTDISQKAVFLNDLQPPAVIISFILS